MYTIKLLLLYLCTHENTLTKATIWALATSLVSLPAFVFDHYINTQIEFLFALNALIVLDTFTGVWKHYNRKTLCWEQFFFKFLKKVGISFCGWLFFHTIAIVFAGQETAQSYFILTGQVSVCVYIAGSFIDNVYEISNKKFPPDYIMDRFLKFKKSGKSSDIFESEKKDLT